MTPGSFQLRPKNLDGNARRLFARSTIHVPVGDEADAVAAGAAGQDSAALQLCNERLRVSLTGQGDEGDVRLHVASRSISTGASASISAIRRALA